LFWGTPISCSNCKFWHCLDFVIRTIFSVDFSVGWWWCLLAALRWWWQQVEGGQAGGGCGGSRWLGWRAGSCGSCSSVCVGGCGQLAQATLHLTIFEMLFTPGVRVLVCLTLRLASVWAASVATPPSPDQVVLCSCDSSTAVTQTWVWGASASQTTQAPASTAPLTPTDAAPLRLAADKTRCVFTAEQLGLAGKGESIICGGDSAWWLWWSLRLEFRRCCRHRGGGSGGMRWWQSECMVFLLKRITAAHRASPPPIVDRGLPLPCRVHCGHTTGDVAQCNTTARWRRTRAQQRHDHERVALYRR
jgi:hypothetical protein